VVKGYREGKLLAGLRRACGRLPLSALLASYIAIIIIDTSK